MDGHPAEFQGLCGIKTGLVLNFLPVTLQVLFIVGDIFSLHDLFQTFAAVNIIFVFRNMPVLIEPGILVYVFGRQIFHNLIFFLKGIPVLRALHLTWVSTAMILLTKTSSAPGRSGFNDAEILDPPVHAPFVPFAFTGHMGPGGIQ